MIQLGDTTLDLSDPLTLAALIGAVVLILLVLLLVVLIVRSGRASQTNAELTRQLAGIGQAVQILGQGQDQLSGGLRTVSDTQTSGQSRMMQAMETRLSEVQRQMQDRLHENAMRQARSLAELNERMNETLTGSTVKTTKSLTELQERLATIDKAQANIEKLSGNVLSLQDILSNKQTRGAFGEIQLNDIVGKALPADSYSMQATLSNGRRADCLIHLPNPPGPIVIDSKFPLEAYEALRQAGTPQQTTEAARALRTAVRAHIKARRQTARSCSCRPKRSMPSFTQISPTWCAKALPPASGSCRPRPAWPHSTPCARSSRTRGCANRRARSARNCPCSLPM